MRKTTEELQTLMIENDVTCLWSWSKFNTYLNDPYSYFLKYIMKVPEDRGDNAYSFLGGFLHDILEKFYKDEVTNEEMATMFQEKVFEQELMDIKFVSDKDKNKSIGNKYIDCVSHFLYNYVKDDNALIEKFVSIKVGNNMFFGYVDKIHVDEKIIYIDDFKGSTIYKGDKIDKEKGQLLLYSMAISSTFKVPISNIRARWNFAKYVNVEYEQVNTKKIITQVERHALVKGLYSKLKTWFNKYGYSDEDFEMYYEKARMLNEQGKVDFDCLRDMPKEIRSKFKISDCLIAVPIDEFDIEEFTNKINTTCSEICEKEQQYFTTLDECLFWTKIDEQNSFFFTNLCGYSSKHHLPLKEYYDNLNKLDDTSSTTTVDVDADFLKQLLGE